MGVARELLYPLAWAAATYASSEDPATRINEYIVTNDLLPPNIRMDRGQPDVWRDYQQLLTELGLMFSTQGRRRIILTPLGLAFVDKALPFAETVTLQALRYQYPNGHHVFLDAVVRRQLAGTGLEEMPSLARLQQLTGVQLRPAVLIWQVLRSLEKRGESVAVSVNEIQGHLMRCSSHADVENCVAGIIAARTARIGLPRLGDRRNAQDWIKFLLLTPLFDGSSGAGAYIKLSEYGIRECAEIDSICAKLAEPGSFWVPAALDTIDRVEWYARFGELDMGVRLIPEITPDERAEEEVTSEEEEIETDSGVSAGAINLRPFNPQVFGAVEGAHRGAATIDSSYDAAHVREKRKLHDRMVLLIGEVCRRKTGEIWEDPDSLDLVALFEGTEFLVEVKTVTSRNFIKRLRYALGQLHHYDYLRSVQSQRPRRKVVALAAHVPGDMWCIPFLNNHMDFDLLSLEGRTLAVHSTSPVARRLFTA